MILLPALARFRLLLTLLVALALACTTLAHRLPTSADLAADLELAQTMAVFGDSLEICGSSGKAAAAGGAHCALCGAGQAVEAQSLAAAAQPMVLTRAVFSHTETAAGPAYAPRSHGARDPPILTL